ncbi:MAG: aminomethyl-transferring glycine dehydrogenase subunit GcvPA [Thiotrichales bacterium]
MPFIPHTLDEIAHMLDAVGAADIEALFDEIPPQLRCGELQGIPPGVSELEITRILQARARRDEVTLNFIGAGAYEHHIPAAVWQITTRGEFYSAYTPYQAEASQGTLQLIYEYQTMMTGLTAMQVSNASLYEGGSALAEAVLMAVRASKTSRSKRILMPSTVHPAYRKATRDIVRYQGIELIDLPFGTDGRIDPATLAPFAAADITALVIPQPNFFGVLEEADALTEWAERHGVLVIAVVNPLTLALLKPPGEWGMNGADIACGDGQPLGVPLSSGGPYYGFLCSKQSHVRQMPGRIVGRTTDADGKTGYVLTLQAREQHIRRSKATSNICTNQGLMVTASTIHMALLGPGGLRRVAAKCHENTHALVERLAVAGVKPRFAGEYFHEVALALPHSAPEVLKRLAENGILGGYPLGNDYPELSDAVLVCATETKTADDLSVYADHLSASLQPQ